MQRDCPGQGDRWRIGRRGAWTVCVVTTVAGFLSFVHGCQRSKPTGPVAPTLRFPNVKLTVACTEGPVPPRLLFERSGAAWARQTGATIRCVPPADTTADIVVLRAVD